MRRWTSVSVTATVVALVAAGCYHPTLTPAGAAVVVSFVPPASSCERLADVHGHAGGVADGSLVGVDRQRLAAYAHLDLRNAAGAIGADYVYRSEPTFTAPDTAPYKAKRVTAVGYNGYAYRCSKR